MTMSVSEAVATRRSIRDFLDTPVDLETLRLTLVVQRFEGFEGLVADVADDCRLLGPGGARHQQGRQPVAAAQVQRRRGGRTHGCLNIDQSDLPPGRQSAVWR